MIKWRIVILQISFNLLLIFLVLFILHDILLIIQYMPNVRQLIKMKIEKMKKSAKFEKVLIKKTPMEFVLCYWLLYMFGVFLC